MTDNMGVNASPKISCLILLSLLLPACSSDATQIEEARRAFSRFQGAILAGDRESLRECLTRDSRKLADTIVLDQIGKILLADRGVKARGRQAAVKVCGIDAKTFGYAREETDHDPFSPVRCRARRRRIRHHRS